MAEQSGAAAITLHGRTRRSSTAAPPTGDVIREVKQAVCIPVFANGDVAEPEDAVRILAHTGADGDDRARFAVIRGCSSGRMHCSRPASVRVAAVRGAH